MQPGRGKRYTAAALAAAALGFPLAARAAAEQPLTRIGSPPSLPAGTTPAGVVASDRPMAVTLALEPRDPAALIAYASAVSAPASPDFRQFLTTAQFVRRFAPAPARVRALERALRASGLVPGALSANGLSLHVAASAGALERAFSISLNDIRLPDGRAAVVSALAPALPASVAGTVQAVIGLSGLDAPSAGLVRLRSPAARPLVAPHVATGGPKPCTLAAARAPGQSAYTADQIAAAYGFSGLYQAGDEGAGVTIAIYELEPVDPSDLAAYQSCYRTDTQITYVPVDGGVKKGVGSGESALDIEQMIGLAPRAHLLVYQDKNSNSSAPGSGPYDEFSAIISQDAAQVVSNSWGQCEPLEGQPDAAAEDVLFAEAASQGMTVLSSSGDSGSEDCDYGGNANGNTALQVDDPASQPFVTGVGGTSLTALGPPPTEIVWNSQGQAEGALGLPGAGGGGISSFWRMPAYQSSSPSTLNVVSTLSSGTPCQAQGGLCREVPDVSADADPRYGYLIYYNGNGSNTSSPSGWQGTGGTSASAPVWAAAIALADADPACAHLSIGFANPALYELAGAAQATYFHDITSGNNDLTGTAEGRYPAGPGYSMATGLGSPNAAALAPALCNDVIRLGTPASELTLVHTHVSALIRGAAPSGQAITYQVSGLPAGLTFDQATGVISGRPARAQSTRVRVQAKDTAADIRTASFAWTVDDLPRVTGATLTAAKGGKPSLALSITAGRLAPPLHTVDVALPIGLRLARRLLTLTVTGQGGVPLAYSASVDRGVLELTLSIAAPHMRLELGPGTLVAGSADQLSAGQLGKVTVTIRTAAPQVGQPAQLATVKARLRLLT